MPRINGAARSCHCYSVSASACGSECSPLPAMHRNSSHDQWSWNRPLWVWLYRGQPEHVAWERTLEVHLKACPWGLRYANVLQGTFPKISLYNRCTAHKNLYIMPDMRDFGNLSLKVKHAESLFEVLKTIFNFENGRICRKLRTRLFLTLRDVVPRNGRTIINSIFGTVEIGERCS